MLSAFQSRTGRNQPSSSKFIFGPSVSLQHAKHCRTAEPAGYYGISPEIFQISAPSFRNNMDLYINLNSSHAASSGEFKFKYKGL